MLTLVANSVLPVCSGGMVFSFCRPMTLCQPPDCAFWPLKGIRHQCQMIVIPANKLFQAAGVAGQPSVLTVAGA